MIEMLSYLFTLWIYAPVLPFTFFPSIEDWSEEQSKMGVNYPFWLNPVWMKGWSFSGEVAYWSHNYSIMEWNGFLRYKNYLSCFLFERSILNLANQFLLNLNYPDLYKAKTLKASYKWSLVKKF